MAPGVEGHLELRGHLARMLRLAVRVDRVLCAAGEQPPLIFDELRLVERQADRPRVGVDGRALSHDFGPDDRLWLRVRRTA